MNGSHWFSRHSKPLIFLIITVAALGIYLAFTIPIAVFPTTNFPRILIAADNGVMPIDQMMVTVTRPIEEAVNSVPGLKEVRSNTSRGSAEIDLFFDWNVDMFQTLQYVNAAVSSIQPELPPTAKIVTNRMTFASFPILGYSMTSDTVPQTQLWELATYELKPRLNRLDGVASVFVQGGQEPEFHVEPDSTKLLSAGVTVTDMLDALRRTNLIDSPGLFERNHQLVLGLISGQVHTPDEIGQVVIRTNAAGIPIRVADVSRVVAGVKPVYTIITADGKPAVLLNINRQPESNTSEVANEVHATLEQIRKTLPAGIRIEPFYDQSILVSQSIKSVRDAILLGLVLASVILVAFLHDWGTSLVAGLVIPVTILITFVVLKLLGQTFNLMTLGGLAAAVGLVIDDAIVVVENIVLHRDAGEGRLQAIRSALKEITVPLIGSTVTPVVVLVPLISITGVYGTFFRALALTLGVSLFASLALALTWTPTLSAFLIRRRSSSARDDEEEDHHESFGELLAAEEASTGSFFHKIIDFHQHWLRRALNKPRYLIALTAVLVVGSFLCFQFTDTDLLPEMDEGGFTLDYWTPAGASLSETNRMILHIEQIVKSIPEVEGTSRRTGAELGLAAVTEANRGDILVKLKQDRSRGIDDVVEEVRQKVNAQEPAVKTEFVQVLQDMIGDLTGEPEPITLKLFSQDPSLLEVWAPKVADAIRYDEKTHKGVEGVVDVLDGLENTISGPAVNFQVDPGVAARAGFTPEEVATDAAAILEGEPAVTPVVSNDKVYTVRVRFPEQNRASLESISNTLLTSATGHTATLGTLATVKELPPQNEIHRENLQREVSVTARTEGIHLGSAMDGVKKAVSALHVPPSIRIEYGGTYEQQQKSFRDFIFVLALAIVLVFIVLLFEFRAFAAPLSILASALLSTSGVFIALLITHTTFNVSSFMGLVMVVGIVAKNGILLLDADQKIRLAGVPAEAAILQASRRRLRPIAMTALATVAGMLPLAFALGSGSQMLQPLAIAVIGGILISMVLSLIITPTVHYYLSREKAPVATYPADKEVPTR
ncbi:MAG TPA: efflux RND transporter permease subunit [Terriglobales bacterium]|nr:efflux RND transporter permease subunit [Terriglobales bacterium]